MQTFFQCFLLLPLLSASIRSETSRRLATGLSQSSKPLRPTICDFPVGARNMKMALDRSSGQYKPYVEVANATEFLHFTLGQGIKTRLYELDLEAYIHHYRLENWKCLTHCTVVDYKNLPPKHPKMTKFFLAREEDVRKSCRNSFAHMFGADVQNSSGHAVMYKVEKISKLTTDSSEFKLCCALEDVDTEEGHAERNDPSRPGVRSIRWREDDFAAYGVFDTDSVRHLFLSALPGLVQIWRDSGEEAYFNKMRDIWQQADTIGASSATLVLTRKNPWKVHVWWVGDSRAKVLNGEASIESHLCSPEIAESLSLKSLYSRFGWNCCNEDLSACTRLSRSLGGSSRLPGISAEPDFADWTSIAKPGSVVAIASHTVWDSPLNHVLSQHWTTIVMGQRDIKRRLRPFAELDLLKEPSAAIEKEFIKAPIFKAMKEGTLHETLEEIVRRSHKLKTDIDRLAGKRAAAHDSVIVVATMTD